MVEARQGGSELDFAEAEQSVGRPERGERVSQLSNRATFNGKVDGVLAFIPIVGSRL